MANIFEKLKYVYKLSNNYNLAIEEVLTLIPPFYSSSNFKLYKFEDFYNLANKIYKEYNQINQNFNCKYIFYNFKFKNLEYPDYIISLKSFDGNISEAIEAIHQNIWPIKYIKDLNLLLIKTPEQKEHLEVIKTLFNIDLCQVFSNVINKKLYHIKSDSWKIQVEISNKKSDFINWEYFYNNFIFKYILPFRNGYLLIYPSSEDVLKKNIEAVSEFLKLIRAVDELHFFKEETLKILKSFKENQQLNSIFIIDDLNLEIKQKIIALKNKIQDLKERDVFNKKIEPFDYQLIGIYKLIKDKKILLGDKMGLGKTLQAIYASILSDAFPILIVCPSTLKYNQLYEFKKYLNDSYIQENIEFLLLSGKSLKNKKVRALIERLNILKNNPTKKYIVIINYDILSFWQNYLKDANFKCIIADEAHYIKNSNNHRSRAFNAIKKYNENTAEYIQLLTGTPILNKPVDLLNLLSILDFFEKYYITKTAFIKKYFYQKHNPQAVELKFRENLTKDLYKVLRQTLYIGRKKEDVLKQLPEKAVNIIWLDFENDKLKSIYETTKQEVLKTIKKEKQLNTSTFTQAVAEINKIRQILSKIKVHEFMNFIDIWYEDNPNDKAVIFAYFVETQEELYHRLSKKFPGGQVLKLTADMPAEKRKEIVMQFQENDNIKYLVISLMAGKEGLNLTKATTAFFIDLDWTPANLEQAENRLHRIGQKNFVNIYYFLVKNSLDEYMWNKLTYKENIIKAIIENPEEAII